MTDWNEHEDAIDDVISDSIDMDWTSRTGAKAVVAWLNETAPSMTRDAEHTPPPQSVVVPVELAETPAIRNALGLYRSAILCGEQWSDTCKNAYLAALRELDQLAMLASAPAPSSLAGGEVQAPDRHELAAIALDTGIAIGVSTWPDEQMSDALTVTDAILAALSPEAPAREPDGMTEDERRRWLAGRSDWREDEWQDHCGRQGCEECRGEIPMTRPRALTPRHEVPADDEMFGVTGACGEVEALACALFAHRCPGIVMHDDDLDHYRDAATRAFAALDGREAPAEGAGEAMDAGFEAWLNERNLLPNGAWDWPSIVAMLNHHEDALRARSSAPEARDGEVVAWRYRSGAAEEHWKFSASKVYADPSWGIEQQPLFTHPAAPSADKLRIAVEALKPFANLGVSSGPDDEPCHYAYRITRGAIRNARQALAVLKAEGA